MIKQFLEDGNGTCLLLKVDEEYHDYSGIFILVNKKLLQTDNKSVSFAFHPF